MGHPVSYADLGNGWYYAHDPDWQTSSGDAPLGYVADSRSADCDVLYGPAAWGGESGPLGGKILLNVGTYPWMSDGRDVAEYPFPGKVEVTAAGIAAGLGHLEGRIVETLDDLVALMGIQGVTRELKVLSREERVAAFQRKMPEIVAEFAFD